MCNRTINQIFQEALEVQDASNLRGVLSGWHRAVCDMSYLGFDTYKPDWEVKMLNALWGGKVASLCKCDFTAIGGCEWTYEGGTVDGFHEAYDFATKLTIGS